MRITPMQRLSLMVVLDAIANDPQWVSSHPKQLAEWCLLAGMSEQRARSMKPEEAKQLLRRLHRQPGANFVEEASDDK